VLRKDVNNFLDHWSGIKESLMGKDILLFLDYDGTLTPIVERPEFAVLSNQTKELIEKLARNEQFKVFIVSGRAMADVKMLVGLDNIVYIGDSC
jgi:trehalose-phosphatase